MAKKEHFIYDANKDGHKPVSNSTEGGSCLTGHDSAKHENFGRKNSCNFRYQGLEQGKVHGDIKRYLHSYNNALTFLSPKYPDGVPTSAYEGATSKKMSPAWYCSRLDVPRSGDWDIGGPNRNIVRGKFGGRKDTIKRQENFTRGKWPYWNNAHHLIPKGEIGNVIMDEGPEVGTLIEAGLLTAKYNINHKINMLLMPQDKEVAAILNMPRHIQNKDGDAPGLASTCTAHPVYDELVREMNDGLKSIVSDYREIIEDATEEECTEPEYTLDKEKLETLSKDLLNIILSGDAGASLDKLASMNKD